MEPDIAIADSSIAEPTLQESSVKDSEDSRTPDPLSVSKPESESELELELEPEPSAEASAESMAASDSPEEEMTAPAVAMSSTEDAAEDAASIPPEFSGEMPQGRHIDPPEIGDVEDRSAPDVFDFPSTHRSRSFYPPPDRPRADISRAHPAWPPSWPQWPRPPSVVEMDFDMSIEAARKAAWEGRLSDALAHYRSAAEIDPESHVVWGEMGNLLWQMQRWPQAAYALEGAAVLLVDEGEFRAALELMSAVESIDPDAAHRIRYHLWAVFSEWAGPRPEPVPRSNY